MSQILELELTTNEGSTTENFDSWHISASLRYCTLSLCFVVWKYEKYVVAICNAALPLKHYSLQSIFYYFCLLCLMPPEIHKRTHRFLCAFCKYVKLA